MKILLSQVSSTSGTSLKTGVPKPYQIYSARALFPFVEVDTSSRKVSGSGLSESELSVADFFFSELFATFQRDYVGLPVFYDLATSADGNGRIVLIGFEKSAQQIPAKSFMSKTSQPVSA